MSKHSEAAEGSLHEPSNLIAVNGTGSLIIKHKCITFNGWDGTISRRKFKIADGTVDTVRGIVRSKEGVQAGALGVVAAGGIIQGVDTSSWVVNTALFCAANGNLTATITGIEVAVVLIQDAINGVIDIAAEGPAGITGATGAQGEIGLTGDPGPQGVKGDPGLISTGAEVVTALVGETIVDVIFRNYGGVKVDHLTPGATEDIDVSLGDYHVVNLDANLTVSFSNSKPNSTVIVEYIQDSTDRTITHPAEVDFGDAPPPAVPSGTGKKLIIIYSTRDTGTIVNAAKFWVSA